MKIRPTVQELVNEGGESYTAQAQCERWENGQYYMAKNGCQEGYIVKEDTAEVKCR